MKVGSREDLRILEEKKKEEEEGKWKYQIFKT